MGILFSVGLSPLPHSNSEKGELPLSEYHCDLLKKSWQDVEAYGPEKIGEKMFDALFEIYPESFNMFLSFCDDPNWKKSAHYKHHLP